jgi:anti-anti-sigma regulatory factor
MNLEETCRITIFSGASAYLFQVKGRGTRRESPSLRDFACGALEDGADVYIDLSECEHLDSTFLGCLVMLFQHGQKDDGTFKVFADESTRRRLFGATRLDQILPFTDTLPDFAEPGVELPVANLEREEFCQHLLETHHRLAELGGPSAETFQRIVDQLKRELKQLPS